MMGEDIYCMVAPGFIKKGRFIWLPYTHHQVAHLAVRRVHGLKNHNISYSERNIFFGTIEY